VSTSQVAFEADVGLDRFDRGRAKKLACGFNYAPSEVVCTEDRQ
jgi:hypothetical protein